MAVKLNSNAFKLKVVEQDIRISSLQPEDTEEVKLLMLADNNEAELDGWPYAIEAALKVSQGANDDVFVFLIPCSLSVAMTGEEVSLEDYKKITENPNNTKKQDVLRN